MEVLIGLVLLIVLLVLLGKLMFMMIIAPEGKENDKKK